MLWGWEGEFRAAGIFFLLSNSLYEFFLAHRPNANVADHSGGPGRVARSRG